MSQSFSAASSGSVEDVQTDVVVSTANDLANPSSTVVYLIDGMIDMGSVEIIAPAGGLFLRGLDYFKSGLYSSEDNHTLIRTAAETPTSNIRIQELELSTSGAGSQIFDLDGTGNQGAIEFDSCNLGKFSLETPSLGELTGFRQFKVSNGGFFNLADGLTFSGTWAGGIRITESIALSIQSGGTLLKEGTSLLLHGRSLSDINASSLASDTFVCNFTPSNISTDAGFQLNGASFNPDADPLPNLPESSLKAFFRDCVGIKNTRVGADMTFSSEVLTPLEVDVETKILGGTTTTNATWFSQTDDNELTYQSELEKDFLINVSVTVDGGPSDELGLIVKQYDDSAASYTDLKVRRRSVINFVGGADSALFTFTTAATLQQDDRIELWIVNYSDGTDITMLSDSELIISPL